MKYMSLGQLSEGAQAVKFFEKGLGLMLEERICQQVDNLYAYCYYFHFILLYRKFNCV